MREHSKHTPLLLALVLCAGACFRFYGLRVGFPFETHVDEWFIIDTVREMYLTGTFRPRAFDYPSLVFYVLLACAHVVGLFREPTLYDLYVAGRAVSALAGTAAVFVVYLTGRRAYNERAGLLAAAFYAFTVTALREAHYYTTDSLNVLCIAAAVYFIVRVGVGDAPSNYLQAGAAIGLAAGSKYNGAFLSVPFLFAHFARTYADAGSWAALRSTLKERPAALFPRRLAAAGLVALAAFVLTTPYALVEPSAFVKDLRKMGAALSGKITEGNHHYLGTTAYWYYVENLLFWAMGPVLEAACLAGLIYALARRRRQDIIIALWVAVYFAVVGGWLNKAVRYTLPMLPFLCLFGATLFAESHEYFKARGRRLCASVVAALAALTLASALLYALAYTNVYRQTHTQTQAVGWLYSNAPAGSTVLLEGPTPHERPQPDGARMIYDDPALGVEPGRFRFKFLNVPEVSRRDADPARQRADLEAALAGVDYVVMSMRWQEGLAASVEASPVIREHYASLTSGAGRFELVREFIVRPRLFGVEINDDRAEHNFRVFDHPRVWIFKRRGLPVAGVSQRK